MAGRLENDDHKTRTHKEGLLLPVFTGKVDSQ